jgi:hypothetical protein
MSIAVFPLVIARQKARSAVFAPDDPAIHLLRKAFLERWMDTRVKPAYDDL